MTCNSIISSGNENTAADGTMVLNGTINSINNDTMFINNSSSNNNNSDTLKSTHDEYIPEFMKYYQCKKPETMPEKIESGTFGKTQDNPKNNFDFLKKMTLEELQMQLLNLDNQMEQEINQLRLRYQSKRQPILKAMDEKRQPT